MKPIIIFTQKDENGNICMSAEKFEKYIQTAYESGVEEGRSKSSITTMRGSDLLGGSIPCSVTAEDVKITSPKACKAAEFAQCSAHNTVNYQA